MNKRSHPHLPDPQNTVPGAQPAQSLHQSAPAPEQPNAKRNLNLKMSAGRNGGGTIPPPQPPTGGFGGHGEDRPPNQLPPVDLAYLYSILRGNARFVVAITLLCALAMLAYLQFVPPRYTAYAQLMLDTRKERMIPVEGVVSNLDLTQSVLAGEVITIRSNVLLGRVVDKLDLVNAPEFDPRLPGRESLFGSMKRTLRGSREKPHEFAARMPPETLRAWIIGDLRGALGVSQLGVSYAIGISFENANPKLAAQIANAVAEEYIQSQLSAKTDATLRANGWLSERLDELSVQVETADQDVVNFKANMIDIANGNADSINQLLAELNTRLVSSSTDRADAEVRLAQVEVLMGTGGLSMVADVVTSPLLETLQRQHAEMAASQAQLASTLGVRHPDMIRINAQIRDINRSINGELRRRLEAMRSEVTVTRNREQALQTQITEVSKRADSLAMASVRLRQLERTADATRLVYESFLSRFKETTAQADFQTPEARIIGKADVPAVPSAPRKTLLLVAAMMLGMAGAIAFVFARNLMRAPVRTPEELADLSSLPNLATLPYIRKFISEFDWLRKELASGGTTPYMEHVRTIRTALFDMNRSIKPKVIVITSAAPNEGKTSLCCALGRTVSRPGTRVLLIDADLRHPDLRKVLELPDAGKCLSEYLRGTTGIDNLVMRSDLAGADVIAPEHASRDAADLLMSPQFDALLDEMSERYDHIILNAPPVLHLADALVLAQRADATLFAVRCGKTRSKTVRNSIRRLKDGDANLVGTVLTMVRRTDLAARETDLYSYAY